MKIGSISLMINNLQKLKYSQFLSFLYPDFYAHWIRVIEQIPKLRPQISNAHHTRVRIIFEKIWYNEDRFWDDVLLKWFNFFYKENINFINKREK